MPDDGPKPMIVRRKVQKVGNPEKPSLTLNLPMEWWEYHGIEAGDELTIIANRDLHVVAPGHEQEVDDLLHEYIMVSTAVGKPKKGAEAVKEES